MNLIQAMKELHISYYSSAYKILTFLGNWEMVIIPTYVNKDTQKFGLDMGRVGCALAYEINGKFINVIWQENPEDKEVFYHELRHCYNPNWDEYTVENSLFIPTHKRIDEIEIL